MFKERRPLPDSRHAIPHSDEELANGTTFHFPRGKIYLHEAALYGIPLPVKGLENFKVSTLNIHAQQVYTPRANNFIKHT